MMMMMMMMMKMKMMMMIILRQISSSVDSHWIFSSSWPPPHSSFCLSVVSLPLHNLSISFLLHSTCCVYYPFKDDRKGSHIRPE
jgi:hypothetical protein